MNAKIICLLLPSVLFGCATGPHGENCGLGVPGSISFVKDGSSSGTYCSVTGTYTNTSSSVVKPVVKLTAFDGSQNTLSQDTIYYDQILPGKQQVKNTHISVANNTGCSTLKQILIHEAYNNAGGKYVFRICGVDGRRLSWK